VKLGGDRGQSKDQHRTVECRQNYGQTGPGERSPLERIQLHHLDEAELFQ
jgi:hypothetical protein